MPFPVFPLLPPGPNSPDHVDPPTVGIIITIIRGAYENAKRGPFAPPPGSGRIVYEPRTGSPPVPVYKPGVLPPWYERPPIPSSPCGSTWNPYDKNYRIDLKFCKDWATRMANAITGQTSNTGGFAWHLVWYTALNECMCDHGHGGFDANNPINPEDGRLFPKTPRPEGGRTWGPIGL